MNTIIKINDFLGNFDNIIGTLGLLFAIIGIIVGGIGVTALHTANKVNTTFKNSNVGTNQNANNITMLQL